MNEKEVTIRNTFRHRSDFMYVASDFRSFPGINFGLGSLFGDGVERVGVWLMISACDETEGGIWHGFDWKRCHYLIGACSYYSKIRGGRSLYCRRVIQR